MSEETRKTYNITKTFLYNIIYIYSILDEKHKGHLSDSAVQP